MAVSAGTEIKRSHLSDILDDVLAEMVSRALITQAQANAMTVDAQEPLAEDINQIYELFGKINTGLNTPVDEGDLLTANELNAVADKAQGIINHTISCSGSCAGLCTGCTGTCQDTCTGSCTGSCEGTCTGDCQGCSGTCTAICSGCTGCSGCSGCGTSCSYS